MSRKVSRWIVYFFAVLWGILTLFPLYVTFLSSVKDNQGINLGMLQIPKTWLWSNYVSAVMDAHILQAVLNSVILGVTSTIVITVVGMLAAYVISRKKFRLNGEVYALFMVGVMVPVHCAIIPISELATKVNGRNSFVFLTLIYVAFNLSQAIFLYVGFLNSVDRELDEAALIDGCNDFQLLFRILFPISIPIIATEAIFTFVYGYGELIFSLLLITDTGKYTVSRAMMTFSGGYNQQLGPIFACIIMAVLPILVFYLFFHSRVQEGMLAGSVKG